MAQRCSRSKAIRHRQQQEQPQQQKQIMCVLKCRTITLKPSLYKPSLYCLSSLRQRAILAVGHSCLSPRDVISRQVHKQTKPRLLLCMRVQDTTCLWNCPHMTYQTEWGVEDQILTVTETNNLHFTGILCRRSSSFCSWINRISVSFCDSPSVCQVTLKSCDCSPHAQFGNVSHPVL